ncbi:hypothetical protein BsWGS_24632 [Bradybaena similaris]
MEPGPVQLESVQAHTWPAIRTVVPIASIDCVTGQLANVFLVPQGMKVLTAGKKIVLQIAELDVTRPPVYVTIVKVVISALLVSIHAPEIAWAVRVIKQLEIVQVARLDISVETVPASALLDV